jgi:hypothetical protein
MIELLLVQAITTAALAAVVIKLRRELWPMFTVAKSGEVGFWVRSADVLGVVMPQFEVAKVVIRVRWLFSEEIHMSYSFRVYDVALHPYRRHHYARWKAWMSGDRRYDCRVKKPRGLARLYNKAIDVFCFEKEEERRPREVIILPSRMRKRGKRIIEVY